MSDNFLEKGESGYRIAECCATCEHMEGAEGRYFDSICYCKAHDERMLDHVFGVCDLYTEKTE